MHYAGIDVSSETLDVNAAGGGGRTFPNTPFGVDALVRWLETQAPRGEQHVVLEPTSTYHHLLVQGLVRHAIPYTLINPARTAAFARVRGKRAKTDRVDAALLAMFGESQQPRPTPPPDEAQEQLKALRRHLDWIREEAQRARNRLGTARRSPWTPHPVTESLERAVRQWEEEEERIQQELKTHIDQDERWSHDVALLTTIPSIARASAILILSELPPVAQCASAKTWVAFAGLCPAPHDSGKARSSHLSRQGSARIRRGLYMPGINAMTWNEGVRAQRERMKARAKPGKVSASAAMSKLLRQCFGVLKSGTPYDPLRHRMPLTP